MSWGTCYSGSNNIHFDYPALMSDGRLYTNWETDCTRNNQIIESNGIQTNYQYRKFLTENAGNIMMDNLVQACDQCGVCSYGYPYQMNKGGKHLYKSCRDRTQPYGYETSDLKNAYLARQELQSRLVAPLLSQQGLLHLNRAN